MITITVYKRPCQPLRYELRGGAGPYFVTWRVR